MTQTIGFIGLGMMGHGIAKNLLKKGYALRFKAHRNRANLQDLIDAGATELDSRSRARARRRHRDAVRDRLAAGRRDRLRQRRAARRGPRRADRDRHVDRRAGVDRPHPQRLRAARRVVRRRAARAHAERGRRRPPEHHGRRERSRLRPAATGVRGVLRKRHPRRAAGPRPRAEARQQHDGDDDGRVDRRRRRGRGEIGAVAAEAVRRDLRRRRQLRHLPDDGRPHAARRPRRAEVRDRAMRRRTCATTRTSPRCCRPRASWPKPRTRASCRR